MLNLALSLQIIKTMVIISKYLCYNIFIKKIKEDTNEFFTTDYGKTSTIYDRALR